MQDVTIHDILSTWLSRHMIRLAALQQAAHRDVGAVDVHREDGVAGQRCDIRDVFEEAAGV